jgi:hypothetical protein
MLNESIIFDSNLAGFGAPATWFSAPIHMDSGNSALLSLHIWWQDVSATFFLRRGNYHAGMFTVPPANDFTVDYRLIDPLWVDPLIGDADSEHIVAMTNVGAKYIMIGWSASDWTGVVAPSLRIAMYKEVRVK